MSSIRYIYPNPRQSKTLFKKWTWGNFLKKLNYETLRDYEIVMNTVRTEQRLTNIFRFDFSRNLLCQTIWKSSQEHSYRSASWKPAIQQNKALEGFVCFKAKDWQGLTFLCAKTAIFCIHCKQLKLKVSTLYASAKQTEYNTSNMVLLEIR